ncbi:glutamate--cysteine ligase [Coemansia sp. RSA 1813]|nr:glutamate--cysteine ligase [Coemansia sp. RSA 1646]KAJ1773593.1 glutamate--cysteine ligase [Coemansia sp. RSA 1843]KAJ2092391.1 glutamate--cysteine ligase [Coemansia sp. RSA 986]KAJ2217384.1 glutamate--cysteine ligase [Coemansia sp. RSA 487]KAJ2572609.1 glutamate--cysteine ligase [Coemansia sp. RSA 1813]
MGLLSLGTPLPWDQAKGLAREVRKHGIEQFLHIWRNMKDRQKDSLLWGDEIEYMLVSLDRANRRARLSQRGHELLSILQMDENEQLERAKQTGEKPELEALWRPEFGRYMIEGTPGHPYNSTVRELTNVEANMKRRREIVMSLMNDDEVLLSVGSYPSLGSGDFLIPPHKANGQFSRSLFLPDEVINPHPRFRTLAGNIRERRGSKVAINMPVFHDVNTPRPFIDPTIPYNRSLFPGDKEAVEGAALPDHIYMDAMGFGMGCCCLQITLQAPDVDKARRLYDQLATVGAVMMSLSAASPIFRGYLADVDCRWNVIAAAVDDRTPEERGLKPLSKDRFVIPKSRYGTIDTFLGSSDGHFKPEYNDLKLAYDHDIHKHLVQNDVDDLMAKHISHLFIRDPLVIFEELLDQDDAVTADHFENIQSTNWQNVRFKPPPPNSPIGWRVEFRPLEVQLTDFENAAFSVFSILLARALLAFSDIDLYIPVTKMDINMERAHNRDAVLKEKFFFRRSYVATEDDDKVSFSSGENEGGEVAEMTANEIVNGSPNFVGLAPIVEMYLDTVAMDKSVRDKIGKYIEFVRGRANGSVMTLAAWMRDYVRSHPDYNFDSVVSPEINHDLVVALDDITCGRRSAPELVGKQ